MRSRKFVTAGLLAALLLVGGYASAGTDLNEVGAFLVYPLVAGFTFPEFGTVETFVTVTNASNDDIVAHVSYINGDAYDSTYCYECDFDLPLTGNDTETLVVTYDDYGITIESMDGTVSRACPHPYGFITVSIEDDEQQTKLDNILLGEEVVLDYSLGMALSIPAVPFQGKSGTDGDRSYKFDDSEYGKLPRVIAADFIAPDLRTAHSSEHGLTGHLALFTLGFERQFPPLVDCSITGYDAHENPFSRSFQFGCWTFENLCDLDPEFCYPNLGATPDQYDEHGWLKLSCRVDDQSGAGWLEGGVHGAIIQTVGYGDRVARGGGEGDPYFDDWAAWGRLMYQSVTGGDAVELILEGPAGGLD